MTFGPGISCGIRVRNAIFKNDRNEEYLYISSFVNSKEFMAVIRLIPYAFRNLKFYCKKEK
jgi:hypothetical protein